MVGKAPYFVYIGVFEKNGWKKTHKFCTFGWLRGKKKQTNKKKEHLTEISLGGRQLKAV